MTGPVCGLCGNYAVDAQTLKGPSGGILDATRIRCSTCGTYEITREAEVNLRRLAQEDRYRFQAVTRTSSERGEVVLLTTESVDRFLETTPQPSPVEQLDLILEYLARHSERPGALVRFDPSTEYPVAFASGREEVRFLLQSLEQKGLAVCKDPGYGATSVMKNGRMIESDPGSPPFYEVTVTGYERLETKKKQPRGATGWTLVDNQLREAEKQLASAVTELQFQAVGHVCRETLISLAQAVYDHSRHGNPGEEEPKKANAVAMLDAYVTKELPESSDGRARALVRAAEAFTDKVTHKRTADFRTAALCLEATRSLVEMIAIIAGKRDR